jgi:hypothetical protein
MGVGLITSELAVSLAPPSGERAGVRGIGVK